MVDFIEAVVFLLPTDAGGRTDPIAPRDGSYQVIVGSTPMRFIEGPPTIEPGQAGRVVIEIRNADADRLEITAGAELEIVEQERVVGLLSVTRLCRPLEI